VREHLGSVRRQIELQRLLLKGGRSIDSGHPAAKWHSAARHLDHSREPVPTGLALKRMLRYLVYIAVPEHSAALLLPPSSGRPD
jgi:hypothetical protein